VLDDIDALLKSQGRYAPLRAEYPWRRLALIVVCGGLAFGAVMGSYGGRGLQVLYSGCKVPLLVVTATLIALPSFFVVNTILGLRDDFADALRAILIAQGTVAICLVGTAPLVAFAYVSRASYTSAILLNGGCFLVAAVGGQITLSRQYGRLIARNPFHRWGRVAWLTLYLFVAVQAAWMLRPFVGDPMLPTRFLRGGDIGNAYVEVAGILWRFLCALLTKAAG
jgi:hypothetical protein